MDFADDGGIGWRTEVEHRLINELGVKAYNVLNPCNKPLSSISMPLSDEKELCKAFRDNENWDGLCDLVSKFMKVDLRMVDKADVLICDISATDKLTGTIHEIVVARQQHKPVYVVDTRGKAQMSGWMLALVGHQRCFDSMDKVFAQLSMIKEHGPQLPRDNKDFLVFDFDKTDHEKETA
jgi:hypothetical protein